jgi:leucyl-tRNA synthetase
VVAANYPIFEERYTTEDAKLYPIAINGKARLELEFPLDADPKDIEAATLANVTVQKWMEGKPLKKFIYVKGKMINVVV